MKKLGYSEKVIFQKGDKNNSTDENNKSTKQESKKMED